MRAIILLAGPALLLTACGNNDQTDNTLNVDENLAAENIVSNDVTAIDAVTGDASNMAADVNYSGPENADANASGVSAKPTTPRTKAPSKPSLEQPAPDETATNNATD
jgi:hypothetical protein